jgi:hypothetical protein
MDDEAIKRFVAGLNNPKIAEELHRLGIKLLEGKPWSRPGVAWDGPLGKTYAKPKGQADG